MRTQSVVSVVRQNSTATIGATPTSSGAQMASRCTGRDDAHDTAPIPPTPALNVR